MTSEKRPPSTKTVLTVALEAEDADKLKQAFADGRLADIGITNIKFLTESEAQDVYGKWTRKEAQKGSQPDSEKPGPA